MCHSLGSLSALKLDFHVYTEHWRSQVQNCQEGALLVIFILFYFPVSLLTGWKADNKGNCTWWIMVRVRTTWLPLLNGRSPCPCCFLIKNKIHVLFVILWVFFVCTSDLIVLNQSVKRDVGPRVRLFKLHLFQNGQPMRDGSRSVHKREGWSPVSLSLRSGVLSLALVLNSMWLYRVVLQKEKKKMRLSSKLFW